MVQISTPPIGVVDARLRGGSSGCPSCASLSASANKLPKRGWDRPRSERLSPSPLVRGVALPNWGATTIPRSADRERSTPRGHHPSGLRSLSCFGPARSARLLWRRCDDGERTCLLQSRDRQRGLRHWRRAGRGRRTGRHRPSRSRGYAKAPLRGCCCPEAAVRAVPARLLLLRLLLSISWLTVQRVADSACTAMQCACAEWNQGRSVYWRDLSGLRVRPVRPGQDARRGDVRGAVPAPGAKWTITNSCDGCLTHDIAHLIASLTSSAIRRSSVRRPELPRQGLQVGGPSQLS